MYDNDSRGISYSAGFFMLIAFAIAGLFISAILSEQIWQRATGLKFTEFEANLSNPAYSNLMKVIQSITAIVGFLVPTLVTAYMLHRKPYRLLGLHRIPTPGQAAVAVLLIVAALLVASSLSFFTGLVPLSDYWQQTFQKMEADYNKQVAAIVNLRSGKDYIIALIVMAFLPALCEEALFRGGLQNFLGRWTNNPWLSIVVVSLLFSVAHLSYYGFLSRFFLGLVLGGIYYYSGKLWLSILAHFLNNALAITVLYWTVRQGKSLDDAMRQDAYTFWGILALPAVIALFILFKRISGTNRRPA